MRNILTSIKTNLLKYLNVVSYFNKQPTYVWYFEGIGGYNEDQFICIAEDENDVIELYNNIDRIDKFYKEELTELKCTLFYNRPLSFKGEYYEHRRKDIHLMLVKKIRIYNTNNQIIYGRTY